MSKTTRTIRTTYTRQERVNAILLVRENNGDVKKIADELGIKYGTLRQWTWQYASLADEALSDPTRIVVDKTIEEKRVNFYQTHYNQVSDLFQKALSKATEMLDGADIREVTYVLKICLDYAKQLDTVQQANDKPSTTNVSLIQQTINKLNITDD